MNHKTNPITLLFRLLMHRLVFFFLLFPFFFRSFFYFLHRQAILVASIKRVYILRRLDTLYVKTQTSVAFRRPFTHSGIFETLLL